MPLDKTQVAELEAAIDDEQLSQVRFGRSRFLRSASLALFGLAAGVFAAPPREAEADPTPEGCHGAPGCGTCRGSECLLCRREALRTCGGNHCWRIRIGCRVYRCCDWVNRNGKLCICRGFVGYVC
jgi:hypothetical protein